MIGNFFKRGRMAGFVIVPFLLGGAMLLGLMFLRPGQSGLAQSGTGPAYLPVQFAPVPTPTPGPPPQFVKNIDLPQAKCPNTAGFNQVSGYMYIVNNFSDNVSVFKDAEFLLNISTGEWPTGIATDPNSHLAWVTNLHSGVSVLEDTRQVAFIPRAYEPYGVVFNPANGYVYVTDLDSQIQIIKDKNLVITIEITDPETGRGAGWMRPIVVDPSTGLVYAASWDYGRLYVIRDTEVIDSVRLGWGPLNMALDEERRMIYVAHSDPNFKYPHDISVVDLETLEVTFVNSTPGSINHARDVAVEGSSGIAYVTNPDTNDVTLLRGTNILGKIDVGEQPWGIGVNPNDGYVFVTNRASESVSIIRDGVVLDHEPVQGLDPVDIAVDTINNDIYVINRGVEYESFKCKHGSVSILQ